MSDYLEGVMPFYTGMTTKKAILTASTDWNGALEFACKPRKK